MCIVISVYSDTILYTRTSYGHKLKIDSFESIKNKFIFSAQSIIIKEFLILIRTVLYNYNNCITT